MKVEAGKPAEVISSDLVEAARQSLQERLDADRLRLRSAVD